MEGGGGGPAPFLMKTYEMVEDSATDEIVSWSGGKKSFVVWNPPELSRLLLPSYFKHNNFSSFIRQLNTYGFRKSDPERWEFANDDFIKDHKHLLKNIHRRKPIHSHSNPPAERAALDEEIEKLTRDNDALQANIHHHLSAKHRFDTAIQRMNAIEKRQEKLHAALHKAVQDPSFIDYLLHKIQSLEFSAYNKKRRLPLSDPPPETSFLENNTSVDAFANPFHQDFSNKLTLELSPAVSDINLLSNSTQSSNEEEFSRNKTNPEIRTEDLFLVMPEAIELTDTGTSFGFKMDSSFPRKLPPNGTPLFHSNTSLTEDDDTRISCQLNLTLASLPLQQLGKSPESRTGVKDKESCIGVSLVMGNLCSVEKTLPETSKDRETPAAPAKVNDVFWEQFLTERPGCTENEETNSTVWGSSYDEQNKGRSEGIPRNARLTL